MGSMDARQHELGPYTLDACVARGGMGAIWKGTHRATGFPVAVKVLATPERRAAAWVRQFAAEVQAVARLDHPHVVLVFDHGRLPFPLADLPAGAPYLVMEWASGGSLGQASPAETWTEVLAVTRQILEALGHAHARGLLHRDLKPDNVLVCGPQDRRPGLKLADFGLAFDLAREGGELVHSGTPRYMAPEQFEGRWRFYGPPTDLYALGVMVWRWVTGAPLFAARTPVTLARAHLGQAPPPLEPRIEVPVGLEDWLRWLLEKEPGSRPPSAAHARVALESLAAGEMRRPAIPDASGPVLSQADTWVFRTWDQASRTRVDPDAETVIRGEAVLIEDTGETSEAAPVTAPSGPRPAPAPGRLGETARLWDRAQLLGVGAELFEHRRLPLLGRSVERRTIWTRARQVAFSRKPELVAVVGPEGSGTSSLVGWLAERMGETAGARVFLVPAHGGLEGLLVDGLRAWGLSTGESRREHVLELLGDQGAGDVELAERLAAALGGTVDAVEALSHLLTRLAAADPERLFVVAAPHGPDPGVIALGRRLQALGAVIDLPVLVVVAGTASPDPAFAPVEVGPLSAKGIERLTVELLGMAPELAGRLASEAGGVPGVVVQAVTDLVRRGRLVPGPEGYVLADEEPLRFGSEVHRARLDAGVGTEEDRRALEALAVFGGPVASEHWRASLDRLGIPHSADRVERWLRAGLVEVGRDGTLGMGHPGLRAAVLDGARGVGREAQASRAVVAVLQEVGLGVAGSLLLAAGHGAEAVQPLIGEGLGLAAAFRYREALARIATARQLAERSRLADDDPRQAGLDAVEAHIRLHRWEPAERVLELVDRLESRARRYGWDDELARALRIRAAVALRRGDGPTASRTLNEALRFYPRERRETLLYRAFCLQQLGEAAEQIGALDLAERTLQQTLELGRQEGLDWIVCKSLASLGGLFLEKGDPERALACSEQALEGVVEGIEQDVSSYRFTLGRALVAVGRLEEADAIFADLVRQGLERLDVVAVMIGTSGLIATTARLGRWAAWAGLLARDRDLTRAHDALGMEFTAILDDTTRWLVEQGELRRAAEVARAAAARWRGSQREELARAVEAVAGLR